jgi:hypothetical protein
MSCVRATYGWSPTDFSLTTTRPLCANRISKAGNVIGRTASHGSKVSLSQLNRPLLDVANASRKPSRSSPKPPRQQQGLHPSPSNLWLTRFACWLRPYLISHLRLSLMHRNDGLLRRSDTDRHLQNPFLYSAGTSRCSTTKGSCLLGDRDELGTRERY